ncbi:MAG: hypothetical protein AAB489_05155 [Patescibacteria group bacterium]
MSPNVIEPGSLDIHEVHLRIGGLITDTDKGKLRTGNKFIVVEHFVTPNGEPVEANAFDVRNNCYSLFTMPKPEVYEHERHKYILSHHTPLRGRTGTIMGGGMLRIMRELMHTDHSINYGAVPRYLCEQFENLILAVMRERTQVPDLQPKVPVTEGSNHLYYDDQVSFRWLQFRQVAEAARKILQNHEYTSYSSEEGKYRTWQKRLHSE